MVWNEASELGRNIGFKTRQLWDDWNAVQREQQQTARHNNNKFGGISLSMVGSSVMLMRRFIKSLIKLVPVGSCVITWVDLLRIELHG
jgi:hypothetical protein